MSPRIVGKSECSYALTEMSYLYVLANPGISGVANQILKDFTTHKTGTVPGNCDEWHPYCDLRPGCRNRTPGEVGKRVCRDHRRIPRSVMSAPRPPGRIWSARVTSASRNSFRTHLTYVPPSECKIILSDNLVNS